MDLAKITSERQVLDVFENLFHKYSNLTELPKLKKRRISQVRKSKVCESGPSTSVLNQSSFHRSAKHPEEQTGEASLHPHSKDQGSFSSGVFSIDSDIDNIIDDHDDDGHDEDGGNGDKIGSVDHEQTSSSEAPSEVGSGVVERSLKEVSFSRNKLGHEGINHNEILQVETVGTGKLTDEDVLFMMHKPRLKKRRKKPPWQRRKLDLDDLWVKGQHLQLDPGSDLEEEGATKLFLDRNLRWGKISLQNYICSWRKSRKGKKRLNSSSRNMSASKKQSLKHTSSGDNSSPQSVTWNSKLPTKGSINEVSVGNLPKATVSGGAGKKGSVKMGRKETKKVPGCLDDVPGNTSEQDFRPRLEAKLSNRASSKAKQSSESASSAKAEGKRTGKGQKGRTKPKESKAELVSIKGKGRTQKNVIAKNCKVSEGSRNSSTSSLIFSETFRENARTPSGHFQKSRKNSRTSTDKTNSAGKKKRRRSLKPARSNDQDHYDIEPEESGGSQESAINFISLTPRMSHKRKLSMRRQRSEEKRKAIPPSTSDSSDYDGYSRSASLHSRGSLFASNLNMWDDEEEVEYRPLFGKQKHCGGIWNTIIEESS